MSKAPTRTLRCTSLYMERKETPDSGNWTPHIFQGERMIQILWFYLILVSWGKLEFFTITQDQLPAGFYRRWQSKTRTVVYTSFLARNGWVKHREAAKQNVFWDYSTHSAYCACFKDGKCALLHHNNWLTDGCTVTEWNWLADGCTVTRCNWQRYWLLTDRTVLEKSHVSLWLTTLRKCQALLNYWDWAFNSAYMIQSCLAK